jgi:hypothetical protein
MTRQKVIRRIVEREQEKLNLTETAVATEEPELLRMACECFGAWDTALLYAGVNLQNVWNQRVYSREQVLQAIRHLCWNGYKMTAFNAQHHYHRLYKTARKYFGSWWEALQAAGVNLELSGLKTGKPRRLTKEEILAALHQWQAAGRSLRWREISLQNRHLAASAKSAFLSWDKALIAAGLRTPPVPAMPRRNLDRNVVLETIRQRQQNSMSLARKTIRTEDPSLLYSAEKYFQGWKAALAAAGVIAKPRSPRLRTKSTTEVVSPPES